MAILIDASLLAGLGIAGPLYGLFLCLFVFCCYDFRLRYMRGETEVSWPMVGAGLLLILFATARFVLDVSYLFCAFIYRTERDPRLEFLLDVRDPIFIARHTLFITSLLVGDLFVNYRCWVVWGKRLWIVVLPLTLAIVAAACGYYALWGYTHLSAQVIFAQKRPLTAFFSASLVANAMATSLLAYRIWSMNSTSLVANVEGPHPRFAPVMRIILESGLLNAAFLFAFVMTLAFSSSSLEIMSMMGTPMCGIVFTIVIFRVGMQRRKLSHRDTQEMLSWVPAGVRTVDGHNTRPTNKKVSPPSQYRPTSTIAVRVDVEEETSHDQDRKADYPESHASRSDHVEHLSWAV